MLDLIFPGLLHLSHFDFENKSHSNATRWAVAIAAATIGAIRSSPAQSSERVGQQFITVCTREHMTRHVRVFNKVIWHLH